MDIKLLHGINYFREGESIFINRSREGFAHELHSHDYIEIAYVAEGEGVHLLNEVELFVSKGDLFIIDQGIPHVFRPLDNEKKLIVYNCIFKPKFLDNNLSDSCSFSEVTQTFLLKQFFKQDIKTYELTLMGENDLEIAELYYKMYNEYTNMQSGYIEILRAYLVALLIKIFRIIRKEAKINNNDKDKILFENTIKFIKQNFNNNIRLDDLAAKTYLSRNYFCSKFKNYTGMTVVEYLQNLRIQEACHLLRSTDMNISDISEQVGYSDIKHFSTLFKKIIKKSPSNYRKTFNDY